MLLLPEGNREVIADGVLAGNGAAGLKFDAIEEKLAKSGWLKLLAEGAAAAPEEDEATAAGAVVALEANISVSRSAEFVPEFRGRLGVGTACATWGAAMLEGVLCRTE